jgi:hypothetical protein
MDPPRLIVEVVWGKLAGRKGVVPPGGRLCVGRSELANLAVTHDGQMSAQHFAVSWDGDVGRVEDLGSIKGTLLDGEAVREGAVGHGGWIRAGATDFRVCVEGHTPAGLVDEEDGEGEGEVGEEERRAEEREEERVRAEAAEKALAVLQAEAEKAPLYAVLDAARDDRILVLLRESVETYRSLYEGVEGEALGDVAPYLVRLPAGSRLLEALVREGWGRRWGIYLTSEVGLVEVRRHLRRFLMVEVEETGEPLYYRFYDPGTGEDFPLPWAGDAAMVWNSMVAQAVYEKAGEVRFAWQR